MTLLCEAVVYQVCCLRIHKDTRAPSSSVRRHVLLYQIEQTPRTPCGKLPYTQLPLLYAITSPGLGSTPTELLQTYYILHNKQRFAVIVIINSVLYPRKFEKFRFVPVKDTAFDATSLWRTGNTDWGVCSATPAQPRAT